MSNLIKILVLTANPRLLEGGLPLRVDAEVREIEEALKRSEHRDRFQVISKLAIRDEDLRRSLLEHKPHIVQFSGHGKGQIGLVLENDDGEPHIVRTEALSSLFKALSGRIECVLLNACYSEPQADAIHQFVDCVIGMNSPIGDTAAISFSEGFYDALGAGELFDKAFEIGCSAIATSGSRDDKIPVLKYRRRPNVVPLVERIDMTAAKPEPVSPINQSGSSQSIGNVTINGNDNASNFISSSGNVSVDNSRTQSSVNNPDLQAAKAAIEQLKQAIASTDELSGTDKKMAAIPIEEIEEEIQKPLPKGGVISQALTSLNTALDKATTLVEPVSKVAQLVAKIGMFVV